MLPVFIKQKRLLRIIVCRGKRFDHTTPLFYKMHALKLFDLIKLKTAVVMFKAYNNMLPVNLQKLFVRVEPIRRTRNVNMFERRFVRTELKSMSLSNCGVKLWNGLEINLKRCRNVGETGVGCHTGWLSHCQYLIRWKAVPCGDLHVTCA